MSVASAEREPVTEFFSEHDYLGYGEFLRANEKMESSREIINIGMFGVVIVAVVIFLSGQMQKEDLQALKIC